jgi:hypothetical protein
MRVWRIFLWYFFWCCASVALLVLSQAIYPWVWMIERRNAGPHEERLIRTEELCARDNPLRSQVASFDCDKWEKSSQPELKKKVKELARVQERLQLQDLDPGIARELRRHVTILEREIGELVRAPVKK